LAGGDDDLFVNVFVITFLTYSHRTSIAIDGVEFHTNAVHCVFSDAIDFYKLRFRAITKYVTHAFPLKRYTSTGCSEDRCRRQ